MANFVIHQNPSKLHNRTEPNLTELKNHENRRTPPTLCTIEFVQERRGEHWMVEQRTLTPLPDRDTYRLELRKEWVEQLDTDDRKVLIQIDDGKLTIVGADNVRIDA